MISLALLTLLAVSPGRVVHATTWEKVWSDEFDGPGINSGNWTYDTGGGGWGNNELEYYTDRLENSYIIPDLNDANNHWLVIEARQEKFRNRNYTSARLKTQGLKNWTYGRMEARINIPGGQGVWPAFWMLGSNFPDVGWPNCGEIDVMEHVLPIGPNTIRGSAHGPNYSGANSVHGDATLNTGNYAGSGELTGHFHVFAVEWEPTQIRWYVDDVQYQTAYFSASAPLPGPWVFDHPFFIILNLAIGGDWPGSPDATTPFPSRMYVDYVRVYRDADMPPPSGLDPLHVSSLLMSWVSNGPSWEAVATVTVKDANGPVSGVTVEGGWSGLIDVGVTQKTTDGNGVAVLNSGKVRKSGTIQFCVNDLIKAGSYYVPPVPPATDCGSISR